MSRARGPRREQLSYHITTPLLGLSIRKCTDFMPKSPVFLLRDVIGRMFPPLQKRVLQIGAHT